jgi:hypothetical protein
MALQLVVCVLAFWPAQVASRPAKEVPGDEVRRILAKAGTKDELELCAILMEEAKNCRGDPGRAIPFAEKAYELSKRNTGGYEKAVETMKLLMAINIVLPE